jgi:hypothetical protein
LSVLQIIASVTSVIIHCEFDYKKFKPPALGTTLFKRSYTCIASPDYECDPREDFVQGVWDLHPKTQDRFGVQSLYFLPENDIKMNILPRNIDIFFPNIELVDCSNNEISYIDMVDLQQFPKLKFLWMEKNLITYIPGNLFQYTPEIEIIWFVHNPIIKIGYNFFFNLPKLRKLNFGYTTCYPYKLSMEEPRRENRRKIAKACLYRYTPFVARPVSKPESRRNNPSILDRCEEKYLMLEHLETTTEENTE